MSSLSSADPVPATAHPVPKLILAALVALLGDSLFHGSDLGLSVLLFLGSLGLALAVARGSEPDRPRIPARERGIAVVLLVAGLLPLVESVGVLSVTFGILGLALFAAGLGGAFSRGIRATVATVRGILLAGPFRLGPDLVAALSHRLTAGRLRAGGTVLLGWVVPLLLCGVFASLFASANPLIDAWLAALEGAVTVPSLDAGRALILIVLASVAWAFIGARQRRARTPAGDAPVAADGGTRLLDAPTVLRCLALFNLLFAVQSVLDAAYLWGGLALPTGITYAAYAHRGAYPLMLTALLAAGFVLVALRPGGPGETSPAIRALVHLWIGQNVLLVISAVLRLDLYVEAYSLTLTRAAAFVWMGLVGVGLVLILARIALRRTNAWLVAANGLTLAATLYACAFVNLPGFVADYNLAHERSGGTAFDVGYALCLGPQAIPAIDRFLAASPDRHDGIVLRRDALAAGHIRRMEDWRAWTFRDGRLLEYLQAHPTARRPETVTP